MDQFSFEQLQQFREANPNVAFALAFVGVLAAIAIVAFFVRKAQMRHRAAWLRDNPQPVPREIARMSEKVTLTAGGAICLFMLIVTVVIAGSRFIAASAIADIVNTGIGLIAGIALWGLGVNIGRRRSYVIETMHTPERVEPEV